MARPKVIRTPVDPSATLKPIRYEKFAQLCAVGIKPEEAYISLGYTAKRAGTCANRLLQREDICARVSHLQMQIFNDQAERLKLVTEELVLTKERVFRRLDHLGKLAEADKKYASAILCERLIGMEVAQMFTVHLDHNVKWDGDLSKLDAAQLEKVKLYMEEKHYGEDRERMEREKAAYVAEWLAKNADAEDLVQ